MNCESLRSKCLLLQKVHSKQPLNCLRGRILHYVDYVSVRFLDGETYTDGTFNSGGGGMLGKI